MSMSTTAFLVLGAFVIVALLSLAWANEWEKRLHTERLLAEAESMLTASEKERLTYEAFYRRHRDAFEAGQQPRGELSLQIDDGEFRDGPRLRLLPGDPDSKQIGGLS